MEEQKKDEMSTIEVVKEELTAQMEAQKKEYDELIDNLRKAHAEEIRQLLRTGTPTNTRTTGNKDSQHTGQRTDGYSYNRNTGSIDSGYSVDDDDDVDDDGISQRRVKAEIDKLNKKLRMW